MANPSGSTNPTPNTANQQRPNNSNAPTPTPNANTNNNNTNSQQPRTVAVAVHPAKKNNDDQEKSKLYRGLLPDKPVRPNNIPDLFQRDFPDYVAEKLYEDTLVLDLNTKATNGVVAQMIAHLEVWSTPCLLRLTDILKATKSFKSGIGLPLLHQFYNACPDHELTSNNRYYRVPECHDDFIESCDCMHCEACYFTTIRIAKYGINGDVMWRALVTMVSSRIHKIISSKLLLAFQQEAYRIDLDDKIAYGLMSAVPPLVAMNFEGFFRSLAKLALDVSWIFLKRFNSILKIGTNTNVTCLNFVTCFIEMTFCYHETLEGLRKHLAAFDFRLVQEECGDLNSKFLFLYFFYKYVYKTRELQSALEQCERTMHESYKNTKSRVHRQFILNLQYDLLRIDLLLQNVGTIWQETSLPFAYNEPEFATWNILKMSAIRNPFEPYEPRKPEVYQVFHCHVTGQWEHRRLDACAMNGLYLAEPILDICLSLPSDRTKRVDCRLYRQDLIANPAEASCAVQQGDYPFLRSHGIDVLHKGSSFLTNVYLPKRLELLLDKVEGELDMPEEVMDFDMYKRSPYAPKFKRKRSAKDSCAYIKSSKVAKIYIKRAKFCKYPMDPRLKYRRNRFVTQEIITPNRPSAGRNMKLARQSSDLAKVMDLVLQAASDILVPNMADRNDDARYKYYIGITNLSNNKHLEDTNRNDIDLSCMKTPGSPSSMRNVIYEHYDCLFERQLVEFHPDGSWLTPQKMERDWLNAKGHNPIRELDYTDFESEEEECAEDNTGHVRTIQINADEFMHESLKEKLAKINLDNMTERTKIEVQVQFSNAVGIQGQISAVGEPKVINNEVRAPRPPGYNKKQAKNKKPHLVPNPHHVHSMTCGCLFSAEASKYCPKVGDIARFKFSNDNNILGRAEDYERTNPNFKVLQYTWEGDRWSAGIYETENQEILASLETMERMNTPAKKVRLMSGNGRPMAQKTQPMPPKDQSVPPKEQPVPPKDQPMSPRDSSQNPNDANRVKAELFGMGNGRCGAHGGKRTMYPDTDGCKCCHYKLKREKIRGIPVNTGYIKIRQHMREKLKRDKIEAQNELEQAEAKAQVAPQPIPTEIPLPTDDVDELVSLIEGTHLHRSDKPGADQRKLAKKARQRERKEQQRIEEEAQRKAEEERLRRIEEEERLKREAEAREEELRLKKEKKKRRRKNKKLGIADDSDDIVPAGSDGKENSKKSNVETPCFAPTGSPGLPLSQNATRKCDMVTIRRHPTTPDTTVTITCQSDSGGEILLRTLVNGQEVLTENSKTEKRVGSQGQIAGNNHGSASKTTVSSEIGKSDANSKKKNKKKTKKEKVNQLKKTETSSDDKRDGSGKENGVVVIENNGRIYDARSVNSAASGSHLNYNVVTSGLPQLPSPFVKSTSSNSLVGSNRPEDRKSFSYFSGLEGDEIDLSKLKLPPGITITKVNHPVKEQGSDESSEEEDDGSLGIPPPGVGLYNQESNMIVMNPDNNDDGVDLAGYTSDDFLLGRVAQFEEVVSSKTKKLRSKAHRNENEIEVGQKKPKQISTQGAKTKRQDQSGKSSTTYDRSKKQPAKNGTNNNKSHGKQNIKVLGENTGPPNRMNGKNPGARVFKPRENYSKDSESSLGPRSRQAAMSSPAHQGGGMMKPSRPYAAAIPSSHIPATPLVYNNSNFMVSEKPPIQKPMARRENVNHHGPASQNPTNSYSPFNSNFDFNVGLVAQSMNEGQLHPSGSMANHSTFPNSTMPRLSTGDLDSRNSQGYNRNGAQREFQSAVTRPSRPTSRQGPQHEMDPNVYGVRTESIGNVSSMDNNWWDSSQQKQSTSGGPAINPLGRFMEMDFSSGSAPDMTNHFKRSAPYGSVPHATHNRYSPQSNYEDFSTYDAGYVMDPRAQIAMVPPVSNGFGIPEEPRRASVDGVYIPRMLSTADTPVLNDFISSLSTSMGAVAHGTFQHSDLGYHAPGPIGAPVPPRTTQTFDRHDYSTPANPDSNAQYSLF